jgi:hypothetical protein
MYVRSLPLALLALTLAASVVTAQYSGDPSQEQGGRHHGGMYGMGHGTPPDPVVLKGPPAPDDFRRLVELPDDKVASYQGLYDRFMAETKPQRDSLAALRNQASGGDTGDRDSFEQRREVFVPLNQELTRRQAAFDDALHDMLDKDQWKRYQKWREEERKVAEQQRQERWKHHQGAPSAEGQPPA